MTRTITPMLTTPRGQLAYVEHDDAVPAYLGQVWAVPFDGNLLEDDEFPKGGDTVEDTFTTYTFGLRFDAPTWSEDRLMALREAIAKVVEEHNVPDPNLRIEATTNVKLPSYIVS